MKKLSFCLLLFFCGCAHGQVLQLGRTAHDKVLPGFMGQNGNAQTIMAGLNALEFWQLTNPEFRRSVVTTNHPGVIHLPNYALRPDAQGDYYPGVMAGLFVGSGAQNHVYSIEWFGDFGAARFWHEDGFQVTAPTLWELLTAIGATSVDTYVTNYFPLDLVPAMDGRATNLLFFKAVPDFDFTGSVVTVSTVPDGAPDFSGTYTYTNHRAAEGLRFFTCATNAWVLCWSSYNVNAFYAWDQYDPVPPYGYGPEGSGWSQVWHDPGDPYSRATLLQYVGTSSWVVEPADAFVYVQTEYLEKGALLEEPVFSAADFWGATEFFGEANFNQFVGFNSDVTFSGEYVTHNGGVIHNGVSYFSGPCNVEGEFYLSTGTMCVNLPGGIPTSIYADSVDVNGVVTWKVVVP